MKRPSDERLLELAQAGDRDAVETLVRRFTGLAYSIADGFYLPGGDNDDLRQEALVALCSAISYHRGDSETIPFVRFAFVVIRRRVITAVKQARALHHGPLTDSVRELADEDGCFRTIVDLLPDPKGDPVEIVAGHERLRRILDELPTLTPLEALGVIGVAVGMHYAELNEDPRRLDNAIQRGRHKLRRVA